jgi:hypothetical protein
MDELGKDFVFKIKWDQVEKVQVHGIVRETHARDFIHPTMLEIQFGNSQMMGECILTDGWDRSKKNDGYDQRG